MEPAKTIITICGGVPAVAKITGRNATSVRRWTYPVEKGGTGGIIPAEQQHILMRHAREHKLPLRLRHFFPADEGAA